MRGANFARSVGEMSRFHRRTGVTAALALCCAASLAAAASAPAAQVSLDGDTLVYRAAPAEVNNLIVSSDETGVLTFSDDVQISFPAPTCRRDGGDGESVARCTFGGPLRVELGDGGDRVSFFSSVPAGQQLSADGGAGDDTLNAPPGAGAVTFAGGDGNDVLTGGVADDVLDGGAGNDEISGGWGRDALRGGEGDDRLLGDGLKPFADTIDGGAGNDSIVNDWLNDHANAAISVTFDGIANDGLAGEGDNVVGVESIQTNQPSTLVAAGDAVSFRVFQTGAGSSRLMGGPANDYLRSYDYADEIDGKGGDDTIEGGFGDDVITGGPGRDTINAEAGSGACNFLVCRGGSGNDTVNARDGEQDSIVCGGGTDSVIADPVDTVAADCETIDRGAVAPPPVERRGGEAPRRAAVKQCVVPKVKAGATLASAKKALSKRGCGVATKQVRSAKVRKGRVVKLSRKAGARLAYRKTVTVYLSRGRR